MITAALHLKDYWFYVSIDSIDLPTKLIFINVILERLISYCRKSLKQIIKGEKLKKMAPNENIDVANVFFMKTMKSVECIIISY